MANDTSGLMTVECSMPGDAYTLVQSGPVLVVHLAGGTDRGGTGPCLCGFDRFAGNIGFSVGGGVGAGGKHNVCVECAQLAGDAPIHGIHAGLFAGAPKSEGSP